MMMSHQPDDLFPETITPHVHGPRRWVPADWIDEITPPGRTHPSDWISWAGGEAPIRITSHDDEPDFVRNLVPGETVEFGWSVDHGGVTFVIRPDGSFTPSRPIPPEVNAFWQIGGPEMGGDTADDFVRTIAEFEWGCPGTAEDEAEIEIDVGMVQWNHENEIFVLAIDPEGRPRFLPVAGILAELSALKQRRDQLLEANNRYLERARAAEAAFEIARARGDAVHIGVAYEMMVKALERQTSRDTAPAGTRAVLDVLAERHRQMTAEGYDAIRDDAQGWPTLAGAAGAYVASAMGHHESAKKWWPWDPEGLKPKSPRRDLVRATSLALAALDTLDRAETKEITHD